MTEIKDIKKMHEQILWTTVRVHTDKAYGSGTVIYCGKDAEGEWAVYVVTCEHVIHDNLKIETKFDSRVGYDIKKETRIPCEVEFFYYDKYSICQGVSGSTKADIVAYDADGDIALLRLRRNAPVEWIANLFPKGKESEVHVFDEVFACGAALAHEPIATHGMINFMNELIDEGVTYWMSSAQIIFGNSGGAIFRYSKERGVFEFLGIPARISVSMSGFSADPITHMGFFIPIPRIYKMLDEDFYQFIYDKEYTMEQCDKLREEYKKEQEKLLMARYGGSPRKEEKPKRRE